MKRVHLGAESDRGDQVGRVFVVEILSVHELCAVDVGRLIPQEFHHRFSGLYHEPEHLLQLVPRQGGRDLGAQVFPRRVLQAEEIPHADAVPLIGAGEVAVGEVVEVANHEILDDLGVAQQQTGLVEDVEADEGHVRIGCLVQFTEMKSRRGTEK